MRSPGARPRRPHCGSSTTCRSPTSPRPSTAREGTVKQHLSRARHALADSSRRTCGGGVMSLDKLADAATRELLEQAHCPTRTGCSTTSSAPGGSAGSPAYATALAVAVLLLGGSWTLLQRDDDPTRARGPDGRDATARSSRPRTTLAGAWPALHRPSVPICTCRRTRRGSHAAQFTADGSELVYPGTRSHDPGHRRHHRRRPGRSASVWTTCATPALSPDGTRLAYGAEEHLKIQTIDTGEAEPILTPGVEHPQHAHLVARRGTSSPSAGPRGLYTVDLESGEVRQLAAVRPTARQNLVGAELVAGRAHDRLPRPSGRAPRAQPRVLRSPW